VDQFGERVGGLMPAAPYRHGGAARRAQEALDEIEIRGDHVAQ
jgi:hypothetical protein